MENKQPWGIYQEQFTEQRIFQSQILPNWKDSFKGCFWTNISICAFIWPQWTSFILKFSDINLHQKKNHPWLLSYVFLLKTLQNPWDAAKTLKRVFRTESLLSKLNLFLEKIENEDIDVPWFRRITRKTNTFKAR